MNTYCHDHGSCTMRPIFVNDTNHCKVCTTMQDCFMLWKAKKMLLVFLSVGLK